MIPWSIAWRAGAGVAALAAVAFACWWVVDTLEERGRVQGRAEVRAEWDTAKERQRQVDAAERDRLQSAFKEAADAAQKQAARDRADAARARAAGDELQRDFAAAVQRCSTAGPAARSETTGAAGDLLAEVFGEVERNGRALAEEADRRGRAGRACEAADGAVSR